MMPNVAYQLGDLQKSIEYILWPWLTWSAKFDEEAHNGLVCIVLTHLFQYISIMTLTSDLQNQ